MPEISALEKTDGLRGDDEDDDRREDHHHDAQEGKKARMPMLEVA